MITVWVVVACILGGPGLFVEAGRKKVQRAYNDKKAMCEAGECLGLAERDPNCVFRCISQSCFQAVYGNNELEPGEIDSRRARQFKDCVRKETRERTRQERITKQVEREDARRKAAKQRKDGL